MQQRRFSRKLPYCFSWGEYDIQTPAVDCDSVVKAAPFVASNCEGRREAVAQTLMKVMRVDSLGTWLHNAELPASL